MKKILQNVHVQSPKKQYPKLTHHFENKFRNNSIITVKTF